MSTLFRRAACLIVVLAVAAPAEEPARLGPAPIAPLPSTFEPPAAKATQPAPQAGGWLDTTNRETVRQSYLNTFVPTLSVPLGWTGSIASGNAGTTTAAYKNAVIAAVNWFRAMAGVPPHVTLNATNSGKAQQAALMFSANRALSHNPPSSWTYWTQEAHEAAGNSNICYNYSDTDFPPGCTVPYMRDDDANNYAAGHRRWILYPQTQQMGTGDVARTSTPQNPYAYPYANALWVFDNNYGGPRPATRDAYVAWPPPGYVPYQLIWLRWSFSYPGANFNAASVTMRDAQGGTIPVALETVEYGYGDNTVVWQASNPVPGGLTGDTPIDVTVSGVNVNGQNRTFQYQVIIFDPAVAGPPQPTGPKTAPGVYRQGSWFLDDGDFTWEGCGVDSCAGFGAPGDVMLIGDFDGDGEDQIGFRRGVSFFLDNGNRAWNGCGGGELCMGLGLAGDTPLIGDWDGDGSDQIGVYRAGSWFLDNGNYTWNGCGTEICAGFGLAGDLPVIGDWNGDGKTQIGLFRAGSWFLDNGNFQWDGCLTETCYGIGMAGDTPVVGDFNGDGKDQVGVFRNGSWFIDDGDFVWEGCGVEICAGFGGPNSQPVPGDYDGDGDEEIAIFDNGFWAVDDGDGVWEGCGVETCIGLGQSGDLPAPGRW